MKSKHRIVCSIFYIELCIHLAIAFRTTKREAKLGRCENILPTYHWFQNGIDATNFDTLNCPNIIGIKEQIFDLKQCFKKQAWEDSELNEVFHVPDSLYIPPITPKLHSGQAILNELNDLRDFFRIYVDSEFRNGLFSSTEGYKYMLDLLANRTAVITYDWNELYEVEANYQPSNYPITSKVSQSIQELPLKYEENPKEYEKFINQYGTHFLTRASFGAFTMRLADLDRKYHSINDADLLIILAKQTKAGFPLLDSDFKEDCHDVKNDRVRMFVNEKRNYTQFYLGGSTSKILPHSIKSVKEWFDSARTNSFLYPIRLRDISLIFPANKSAAMKQAIKVYMGRAHLDEIKRLTSIHIKHGFQPDNKTENLIERINKVNESAKFNLKEIEYLSDNLEQLSRLSLHHSTNAGAIVGLSFKLASIYFVCLLIAVKIA